MILYLDTSSLVKLYVEEEDSSRVAALVEEALLVATSTLAYTEARAALARRRREGDLTPTRYGAVVRRFEADWSSLLAIELTDVVAREAGALAERLALRGADAVHLASFAELVARADGDEVVFSTADDRLARSAKRLG